MLTFVVPGPLDQITGGYLFDRHIVEGARALGRSVRVIELPGQFPAVDATAREAVAASLASEPDGSVVVIDGLALPGYERCVAEHACRLKLVGFIHHPLSLETGLSPSEAEHFAALEAALWRNLHAFVCPSAATALAVQRAGIESSRIAVCPPGTAKPIASSPRAQNARVRLLTVGTVSPRKGYHVLVDALAPLRALDWELVCIGSLERNPQFSAQLRDSIALRALDDRIALAGELLPEEVQSAYANADVFVLPSFHEGYGMAYAEALVHGLPVIATSAGAIPTTVPISAALFVEPGDVEGLTDALRRLIVDASLRASLAEGAIEAAAALPSWEEAVSHWLVSLDRLTA